MSLDILVVKLTDDTSIAVLHSFGTLFIQQFNNDLIEINSLIEIDLRRGLPLDPLMEYLYSSSIGILSNRLLSIVFSEKDNKKNWLMFSVFPQCISKEYFIKNNEVLLLIQLGNTSTTGNKITFANKTPNIINEEKTNITLKKIYDLDTLPLEVHSGGVFEYSFYISELYNQTYIHSLECSLIIHVCFANCKICSSYGDINHHQCITCMDNYNLDSNNNCQICDSKNYYYDSTTNKLTCLTDNTCTPGYPYLIEGTSECMKQCHPIYEIDSTNKLCKCTFPKAFDSITKQCVCTPKYILSKDFKQCLCVSPLVVNLIYFFSRLSNFCFNRYSIQIIMYHMIIFIVKQ